MEENKELHEFKLDETILRVENPNNFDTGITVPSNEWRQTFRKTDAVELTKIIKDTTVTQASLIRLMGSYSTKMLNNLSVNKKLLSGIEGRPSKVFYNEKYSINEAMNNDMLSYISYAMNYLNKNKENVKDKMYLDNIMVVGNKLYFNIYLNQEDLITAEGIHLSQKDLITNEIQFSSNNMDYLKIFVTDSYNHKMALTKILANVKEDFIFMTVNKHQKKIKIILYKDGTELVISKRNLLQMGELHLKYNNKELYGEIKNKYEFERKIVGKTQ